MKRRRFRSKVEEILPGVHRLVLPLPGRRPGPVNAYLFTGDNVTLVDTGTAQALPYLLKGLKGLGLCASDIDRIVLTHGHLDHYGCARALLAQPGARAGVLASPYDEKAVATGKDVSRLATERFLKLAGAPLAMRAGLLLVSVVFGYMAQSVPVTGFLQDGDEIVAGKYRLKVLETPGHTRGSLCLHLEEEGVVFSGDHVLAHVTPNALVAVEEDSATPRRRVQQEFYDSLARIEGLQPRLTCPGHGRLIRDLPRVADMYRRLFAERQEKTLAIFRRRERTVYEAARELFPGIRRDARLPLELFLSISEVYTHVQELSEQGLVHTRIKRKRLLVNGSDHGHRA
ncbi:MAG: MBL fold metallo-hydrolase [Thermodesulfobacteriota bacterium]